VRKHQMNRNFILILWFSCIIFFLVCVAFLEHKRFSKEAFDKEVTKLSASQPDGEKSYDIYCTIVFVLLETFLKNSKSGEDISDVLRELKFQEECVEDLSKVLSTNHQSLYENYYAMMNENPIDKLQYRIDISLCER
jgi:COMM domain containing 5